MDNKLTIKNRGGYLFVSRSNVSGYFVEVTPEEIKSVCDVLTSYIKSYNKILLDHNILVSKIKDSNGSDKIENLLLQKYQLEKKIDFYLKNINKINSVLHYLNEVYFLNEMGSNSNGL